MAGTRQIGFLVAASPDNWTKYINWFKAKLRTRDINITFLPPAGAAGDANKVKEAATYLAGNVEVIVTAGTQAALACKAATQVNQTPFVFASVGDPAISGLMPQPGGNFTGGSNQQVKLVGARVDEMLKPAHHFGDKLAVVGHDIEPITSAMTAAVNALTAKGRPVQRAPITPQDNITTFITGLKNQGVKSLYVCSDMLITTISTELNTKARAAGMQTMYEFAEHVDDHGGDLSYGVKFKDLLENAAICVDKILDGTTKAGDIPIFEPSAGMRQRAVKKKSRAYPAKKRAAAPKKKKKKSRRGP